jgi:hypothetical protein
LLTIDSLPALIITAVAKVGINAHHPGKVSQERKNTEVSIIKISATAGNKLLNNLLLIFKVFDIKRPPKAIYQNLQNVK